MICLRDHIWLVMTEKHSMMMIHYKNDATNDKRMISVFSACDDGIVTRDKNKIFREIFQIICIFTSFNFGSISVIFISYAI